MSRVRTLDRVLLLKFTTNINEPSKEMARLLAASPVFTDLPILSAIRFQEATLPDRFIVTYIFVLSGDKTIARGLLPTEIKEALKFSKRCRIAKLY